MPAPNRGAILDKASQIIAGRMDELAAALTREEGKTLAEAKGEAIRARDLFRYFGGEGWRIKGDLLPGSVNDELIFTRREPLGVIGMITPWNFPAGDSGVEESHQPWPMATPLCSSRLLSRRTWGLMLVEALSEAGLPPGVLNYVTGSGREVGDEIVNSPDVNGISFTGSYDVGTRIYAQAIKNLTRVQLEMGGKNPTIVLNDAKLDLAVDIVVKGGFGLTGQALHRYQPRDRGRGYCRPVCRGAGPRWHAS